MHRCSLCIKHSLSVLVVYCRCWLRLCVRWGLSVAGQPVTSSPLRTQWLPLWLKQVWPSEPLLHLTHFFFFILPDFVFETAVLYASFPFRHSSVCVARRVRRRLLVVYWAMYWNWFLATQHGIVTRTWQVICHRETKEGIRLKLWGFFPPKFKICRYSVLTTFDWMHVSLKLYIFTLVTQKCLFFSLCSNIFFELCFIIFPYFF